MPAPDPTPPPSPDRDGPGTYPHPSGQVSHACAVCGRVLDYVVGFGWKHTEHPDDPEHPDQHDHPAVPVPAGQVSIRGRCDLCDGEPVVAVLHTDPITVAGVTDAGDMEPLSGYDGAWGCCAVCARLVRRGRWEQLTARAVAAIAAASGTPVTAELTQVTGMLHARLRETMHGPPEPLPADDGPRAR